MERECWIGGPLPGPHVYESRRAAAEWDQRWRREHSTDVLFYPPDDQLDLLDRSALDPTSALD